MRVLPYLLGLAWLTSSPNAALGQAPDSLGTGLTRVFLDCAGNVCDSDRILQEVQFVLWVREPNDADVHVLISSVAADTGETEYNFRFVGLGAFESDDLDLTVVAPAFYIAEERIRTYVEALKAGLVHYAVRSDVIPDLRVTYRPWDEAPRSVQDPAADPWRSWVFQLDVSGSYSGQSSTRTKQLEGTFRAGRITEGSKTLITLYGSGLENEFEFEDRTLSSRTEYFGANSLLALTTGPRSALGVTGEVYSSTFNNTELLFRTGPAVEVNLFPYSQSAQNHLTVQYSVGWNDYAFYEETLFGKTNEVLWDHAVLIDMDASRTWGSAGLSALVSQHLGSTERYRIDLGGNVSVRVFRGISFYTSGRYQVVRDQITLRRAGATDEEVLLRQRELETSFSAFAEMGIQLRFGSSQASIVNTRLDRRR
jgi:hypothetical protein